MNYEPSPLAPLPEGRGELWAYRLFYGGVVLSAAASLALPDLLKIPQDRAEEIVMVAFLPVCLFVAWALRPAKVSDGSQQVDA